MQLRIASLYQSRALDAIPEIDAAVIWWKRISYALAARGHSVDFVGRHSGARWSDYDVILTFLHKGAENLLEYGGFDHPCVISSLGSVVGARDGVEGTYFFGESRAKLFEIQKVMAARSAAAIILTEESRALWIEQHGRADDAIVIPQGVDAEIPQPGRSPFGEGAKVVVYVGNIYKKNTQLEMNLIWQARLNNLGRELQRHDMRLCHVGTGDTELLDPALVTTFPPVDSTAIWDYQYFASAAVVFAQGAVQHNESTKLYHHLRVGLPPVSEAPVPNNHVIEAAGLGFIAPYNDDARLADLLAQAAHHPWNRARAMDYMRTHHNWEDKAKLYEDLCFARLAR